MVGLAVEERVINILTCLVANKLLMTKQIRKVSFSTYHLVSSLIRSF